MRPISLAVDVTNYVMLELGQPIHGYDRDRLAGPIVVRRARRGRAAHHARRRGRARSSVEDLLITDDSGPIGLAGVMGGETTELSATTTNILIEAAHWDPVSIFRTARRHKLPSEAAKRFERGVDPTLAPVAADRVAELLTPFGGGTVEPGVTVVGEPPARPSDRVSADLPARVTGMEIDAATTVRHLRAVGCAVDEDGESPDRDPAPVARRHHRPLRPGRGGRPHRRLRPRPLGAAARPVGRRPDPQPAAAPPGRRTLAGAGLHRGGQLPVRRRRRPRRARPGRPTTRAAACCGWPTRLSEEPPMTTTLLPGCSRRWPATPAAGSADVALFEPRR